MVARRTSNCQKRGYLHCSFDTCQNCQKSTWSLQRHFLHWLPSVKLLSVSFRLPTLQRVRNSWTFEIFRWKQRLSRELEWNRCEWSIDRNRTFEVKKNIIFLLTKNRTTEAFQYLLQRLEYGKHSVYARGAVATAIGTIVNFLENSNRKRQRGLNLYKRNMQKKHCQKRCFNQILDRLYLEKQWSKVRFFIFLLNIVFFCSSCCDGCKK